MEALNYHHLRLFWAVAREQHLTRASRQLHLTPQTVSTQIRDLEATLGETLFRRVGRRMELTEAGQVALRYAEEIFALGRELHDALRGEHPGRPIRLVVGVADVLPKLVAHRLIAPAFDLPEPLHLVCREGTPERLLVDLAMHELDVVLSDAPIPASVSVRAYNHLLGNCGITFMASPRLAKRLRRGFPRSLDGAPALLPGAHSVLRKELGAWFDRHAVRPVVVGEFDDSALLKVFGQHGGGFFAVPSVVHEEIKAQYGVVEVGSADDIVERFYAISVERRVRHPAAVAICDAARSRMFA